MIGATITKIRKMTKKELKENGWGDTLSFYVPTVIEFSNGTIIFASQDDEGNGPGALFGTNKAGDAIVIAVD